MRKLTALLVLTTLGACAPAEDAEPVAEDAMEAEPAGPDLAQFAGTWQNQATIEGVDDPIPSTMHATSTAEGWTMDLEGRPGIPATVHVMGDSLIVQTDQYESILREGVMVSVRTASVLRNDSLIGNLQARYVTDAGEELVTGTMRGVRSSN